ELGPCQVSAVAVTMTFEALECQFQLPRASRWGYHQSAHPVPIAQPRTLVPLLDRQRIQPLLQSFHASLIVELGRAPLDEHRRFGEALRAQHEWNGLLWPPTTLQHHSCSKFEIAKLGRGSGSCQSLAQKV